MKLFILAEREFQGSLWFTSFMNGVGDEVRKKRYTIELLDDISADEAGLDRLYGNERRLLIIAATSISGLRRLLPRLERAGVCVLLVNISSDTRGGGINTLMMDYEEATLRSIEYLRGCDKSRIALFGINADSGSDQLKLNTFYEQFGRAAEGAVFFNTSGLADCAGKFIGRIGEFDAVLCANDIAVTALMLSLREAGIRVPEDIFAMSFGDRLNFGFLSQNFLSDGSGAGVTTVSVDHYEMGRQAVRLCGFLSKENGGASMSVTLKIRSTLHISASTADMPERAAGGEAIPSYESARSFYDDETVDEIMRLEALAASCDEVDRMLIRLAAENFTLPQIAERIFISESAVVYRLRRIYGLLGVGGRGELSALLEKYMLLPRSGDSE